MLHGLAFMGARAAPWPSAAGGRRKSLRGAAAWPPVRVRVRVRVGARVRVRVRVDPNQQLGHLGLPDDGVHRHHHVLARHVAI